MSDFVPNRDVRNAHNPSTYATKKAVVGPSLRDLRVLMQQVAPNVALGLLFAVFQKDPWSCDLCDLLPLKIP